MLTSSTLHAWYRRDWKALAYQVCVNTGLSGTFYPRHGFGWCESGYGLHADAPAVMDDFGNLVIVGGWS